MNSSTVIRMVAERELRVRLRSKGFAVLLAVSAVLFAALPLVRHFVDHGSSGPGTEHVAVLTADADEAAPLEQLGARLGQQVQVRTVPDPASGTALVKDGQVDAFVQLGTGAAAGPERGSRVVVKKTLSAQLGALFHSWDQQSALVASLGGDPAKVAPTAPTPLQVTALKHDDPERGQRLTIAIAAGILLYVGLMSVGQVVAQGVVEEKSSRVVELLLATIRPWQLLAGKVLGTGVLGLIQVAVPGAIGLGVASALGEISIPVADSVGSLAWAVVWFLAGFFVYALIAAAAGATVSRQEDLNGVMTPIMLPLIGAWVIGISTLPGDPGNGAAAALSYVPLFAPVLMPMRYALGSAPVWQVLVALALTLATGAALLRLSGRVYRNSVLRSGARVSLREALRAA